VSIVINVRSMKQCDISKAHCYDSCSSRSENCELGISRTDTKDIQIWNILFILRIEFGV